ncbi:MAG: hypothetical protein RR035_08020, partial [Oscillibacter sp.]
WISPGIWPALKRSGFREAGKKERLRRSGAVGRTLFAAHIQILAEELPDGIAVKGIVVTKHLHDLLYVFASRRQHEL